MAEYQLSEKMLRQVRSLTNEQFEQYVAIFDYAHYYGLLYLENNATGKYNIAKFNEDYVLVYKQVDNVSIEMEKVISYWRNLVGVGDAKTGEEMLILKHNNEPEYHILFDKVNIVDFLNGYTKLDKSEYISGVKDYCQCIYRTLDGAFLFFGTSEKVVALTSGHVRIAYTSLKLSSTELLSTITDVQSKIGEIHLASQLSGENVYPEHTYILQKYIVKVNFTNNTDRSRNKDGRILSWVDRHANNQGSRLKVSMNFIPIG